MSECNIEVTKNYQDPQTGDEYFVLRINAHHMDVIGKEIASEIVRRAGEDIAARYLEAHAAEILAKLNPEAVASMAIAEAGAAMNDTLKMKHAERKVVEHHHHESRTVYQRGIFGGLRRV